MSGEQSQVDDLARLARHALAGRVARDMAHDINDLLVGVVTVGEEGMSASTMLERRRALETIVEHGQRITELVRAFQVLFSDTKSPPPPGPVDVGEVLKRALFLCHKRIARQGVEVKQNYGSLPRVRAGIGPVEQVFIELLHDALDALSSGGVLDLAAERAGEFVAVTVSSTATGTPPADTGKALEWFGRSDDGVSGAGRPDVPACWWATHSLGLAAARQIVRQYGGELSAQSTLGEGSRFTVLLPVYEQNAEP